MRVDFIFVYDYDCEWWGGCFGYYDGYVLEVFWLCFWLYCVWDFFGYVVWWVEWLGGYLVLYWKVEWVWCGIFVVLWFILISVEVYGG